jgi:hypothetical protein
LSAENDFVGFVEFFFFPTGSVIIIVSDDEGEIGEFGRVEEAGRK